MFLSNKCFWHKHIDNVKEKAWCRINVIRRLKLCLDRKSLESIYLTFIRPVLEYAHVAFGNCTNYEKQEAAMVVAGATKRVPLHALYDQTGNPWKQMRNNYKAEMS